MPDKNSNNPSDTSYKEPTGAPELPENDKTQTAATPPAQTETVKGKTPPVLAEPANDSDLDTADEPDSSIKNVAATPPPGGRMKHFFRAYWRHKWWTLPLTIIVIIAILLAVPFTRYRLLGLFLQRSYSVTVIDSYNKKPVSGAVVTIGDDQKLTTGANGQVQFKATVGRHDISISKQYYRSYFGQTFVGISTKYNHEALRLTATGRQVPVSVIDHISGQPIADATVAALDTSAKTDSKGQAVIVLPAGKAELPVVISASKYNQLKATISVSESATKANTFSLTPAGKVYFLSNASGTYDIKSANLDGSDVHTVVTGTGSEGNGTSFYMSPNSSYGVLLANRSGTSTPQLYAVDISSGKLSPIDTTNAIFTTYGWSGNYFVYLSYPQDKGNWQPGNIVLKSYDALSGKTITLVSNQATGSGQDDYAYQGIGSGGITVLNGYVYYENIWASSYGTSLKGRSDGLMRIKVSGGQPQTLQNISIPDDDSVYVQTAQTSPDNIIYDVMTSSGDVYYRYDNNVVSHDNTLMQSDFSKNYPNYLPSPSGQKTFWAEPRDGKNTLFVGDASGDNATQIATLSSYTPYGWYTDSYLLVSKDNTLYIMPVSGSGTPLELGNYLQNPSYM